MAPHPLTEVDPAALVIARLAASTDVAEALAEYGGSTGRVAGVNRPPYPRVSVSDPPGGGTSLRWLVQPTIQVETLGDLDGSPGKAALRAVAVVVATSLWSWPDDTFGPDDPVVTNVAVTLPGWLPLATGQARYVSTASLSIHPPNHR